MWVVRENKNMESFQVRKMYQAMPSLAGMESQHWQQMKGATACKYMYAASASRAAVKDEAQSYHSLGVMAQWYVLSQWTPLQTNYHMTDIIEQTPVAWKQS